MTGDYLLSTPFYDTKAFLLCPEYFSYDGNRKKQRLKPCSLKPFMFKWNSWLCLRRKSVDFRSESTWAGFCDRWNGYYCYRIVRRFYQLSRINMGEYGEDYTSK